MSTLFYLAAVLGLLMGLPLLFSAGHITHQIAALLLLVGALISWLGGAVTARLDRLLVLLGEREAARERIRARARALGAALKPERASAAETQPPSAASIARRIERLSREA